MSCQHKHSGRTALRERRKRALERHYVWLQTLSTAPDIENREEAVERLHITIRNTEANLVK